MYECRACLCISLSLLFGLLGLFYSLVSALAAGVLWLHWHHRFPLDSCAQYQFSFTYAFVDCALSISLVRCVKGESKGENKDQNQHNNKAQQQPYYIPNRENVQTVNKSVIKFITECLSLARSLASFHSTMCFVVVCCKAKERKKNMSASAKSKQKEKKKNAIRSECWTSCSNNLTERQITKIMKEKAMYHMIDTYFACLSDHIAAVAGAVAVTIAHCMCIAKRHKYTLHSSLYGCGCV